MIKEQNIKAILRQLLVFLDASKIILIFILISFQTFSQKILHIDSLKKDSLRISHNQIKQWTKNENGVIFFCTNDYPIQSYEIQLKNFKISRIDSMKPFSVNYILYNEYDNNSKNPFFQFSGIKDSVINQIECYIICDNKDDLNRAIKLFSPNFYILNKNEEMNLYQLSFKGICPKDLTYSISLYYDFIYEIFNPQYTLEEKIKLQEFAIIQLNKKVETLNKQIIDLEKKNQVDINEIKAKLKSFETIEKKRN